MRSSNASLASGRGGDQVRAAAGFLWGARSRPAPPLQGSHMPCDPARFLFRPSERQHKAMSQSPLHPHMAGILMHKWKLATCQIFASLEPTRLRMRRPSPTFPDRFPAKPNIHIYVGPGGPYAKDPGRFTNKKYTHLCGARDPFQRVGLKKWCRMHQKSAQETKYKAEKWCRTHPQSAQET